MDAFWLVTTGDPSPKSCGITGDGADGEYGIVEELINIPEIAHFGEINGKYIC